MGSPGSSMALLTAAVLTACSAGGDGADPVPAPTGGVSTSGATGGVPTTGGAVGGGAPSAGPASGGGGSGAGGATVDWPEADATRGPCLPGRYVGTFKCIFNDPTNPLVPKDLEVTGPVAFNLAESRRGEFLEIADGTIDGAALVFVQFAGPLEGELDCGSKRFTAKVVNGTSFAGPFTGDMQGTLDPGTQALAGQWSLTATALPDGACVGPWSVVRQP